MFTRTITAIAGATIGLGIALSIAPAAGADAETLDEIAYIMALDEEGIAYSTEDAALEVAYGTCDALAHGATPYQVIAVGVDAADGYYSEYQVGYITGAAIAAFCPWEMPAGIGA